MDFFQTSTTVPHHITELLANFSKVLRRDDAPEELVV